MPGGGGKLRAVSDYRPGTTARPLHVNLPIIRTPAIRPTPTLLTATPIAFTSNGRHTIERAAFDAGTTLGTAGYHERSQLARLYRWRSCCCTNSFNVADLLAV